MCILTDKLTDILDTMAPLKTIQIRKHRNTWISEDTLEMMQMRDNLQRVASENNCRDTWKQYTILRNKLLTD